MGLNVREGGDDLGLGRELCALLELEVTNGAGESKIAVNTAKVNKATGGCDTGLLGYEGISGQPQGIVAFAMA